MDPSLLETVISREDLYVMVWETPVIKLAEQFGISDVGLKKICKRNKIPTPPLGYWRRVETGQKPRQPKLPKLNDPYKQKITIRANAEKVHPKCTEETLAKIEAEQKPEKKIVVTDNLDALHPSVAATYKSLKSTKVAYTGLVTPKAKRALVVSISPGNIEHVCKILDALVRALEDRGCSISGNHENDCCTVVVNAEKIDFRLYEITKKTRNDWNQEQYNRGVYHHWNHELTDRLCLEITTNCRDDYRRNWADGRKQRVEKCLNGFVSGLYKFSDSIKYHRKKDEERRLQREQWQRQRWEKLHLIEAEEKRIIQLLTEADSFEKSQKIRRYIEAVRKCSKGWEDRSEVEEWLEWATAQADRADPLVESPPSILDEKEEWKYFR